VGGGPAEEALQARAAGVNRHWGREVVRFTGPMSDPRSAYAAADVVVGMGSSALRAMSIGRPVVVQGESGFSQIFEPDTLPYFLRHGFWGLGDDDPTAAKLAAQLHVLLTDSERRARLEAFGRRTVEDRFSLRRFADELLHIYGEVADVRRRARAAEIAVTAARALQVELENHDPRRKRERHDSERSLLTAASG
jgi:glycosyltransferase involved in cell wall biosynthesis